MTSPNELALGVLRNLLVRGARQAAVLFTGLRPDVERNAAESLRRSIVSDETREVQEGKFKNMRTDRVGDACPLPVLGLSRQLPIFLFGFFGCCVVVVGFL